ncbi:hypothetical protein [Vibrio crassostreae]|nr:hypothetical protein [Vibrio crassostreae]
MRVVIAEARDSLGPVERGEQARSDLTACMLRLGLSEEQLGWCGDDSR